MYRRRSSDYFTTALNACFYSREGTCLLRGTMFSICQRSVFIFKLLMCVCTVAAYLRYYCNVLEGETEDLGQDKSPISQNSNQGSPEYEAWLTLEIENEPL
jgi:hypothetical protein